jgi:SAM-dependent methyltransferase
MARLRRVRNAITYVRRHGLRATAQYAFERASESYHEWRLGIRTMGNLSPGELGIDSPFSAPYYPADYRSIYRAFRRFRVRPHQDGFLDYGCGMGRIVVVASTFPFRRIVGIELSPTLSEVARDNLKRARKRARCGNVEVVTADAAGYEVPAEITVVFFYNPFHGPVLASALGAIRESLVRAPREVRVVFKNTAHLEPMLKEHPWLVKRDEFPACDGNHKVMILEGRA